MGGSGIRSSASASIYRRESASAAGSHLSVTRLRASSKGLRKGHGPQAANVLRQLVPRAGAKSAPDLGDLLVEFLAGTLPRFQGFPSPPFALKEGGNVRRKPRVFSFMCFVSEEEHLWWQFGPNGPRGRA